MERQKLTCEEFSDFVSRDYLPGIADAVKSRFSPGQLITYSEGMAALSQALGDAGQRGTVLCRATSSRVDVADL